MALLWNYEDVLNILWEFNDIVLAYIAGHSHEGGYFYDEKTIHHLTLHAIVECEPNTNSFATVHVYEKYLIIEGVGRIDTYRIDFSKKTIQ
jgi:manganese-dependent ADP-ribose/CDP-alcohol diphosphatase